MRLTILRSILIGIISMFLGTISAPAQESDAKLRARQILNQAREALGGDEALNAVRSLSGSGDFRSGAGAIDATGDVQLDLLLPDRLMWTMKWSPTPTMKVTSIEAINGDQVWTDTQMKQPQDALGGRTGGGGMARGGGRHGGGMGGGAGMPGSTGSGGQPEIKGPAPELGTGRDRKQMLLDSSCLLMGLLLRSPESAQAEFIYAGDGDVEGVKADLLKIVAEDGTAISLAVDQKTHRPIMAAYKESMMAVSSGAGRSQDRDDVTPPEPETAEVQIYFSEFRVVSDKGFGDIWLPHQITKARNGQTVEDMHLKKYQLNPHLKPRQFEKKV